MVLCLFFYAMLLLCLFSDFGTASTFWSGSRSQLVLKCLILDILYSVCSWAFAWTQSTKYIWILKYSTVLALTVQTYHRLLQHRESKLIIDCIWIHHYMNLNLYWILHILLHIGQGEYEKTNALLQCNECILTTLVFCSSVIMPS